jgi:heme oxygenase
MLTLTARLRAATGETHARIEQLPLAAAMADGTVDRDDYVHLLRMLLGVHLGWEPCVAGSAACGHLWTPDMARVDAIRRDLTALGADPTPVSHPAARVWLAAAKEQAEVRPELWLGVLYLFEGSRMGSLAMARPLARALGVAPAPGNGLDYHLDGAAGRPMRFAKLKAAMDALALDRDEEQAAVRGAAATFQMLYRLYSAPALVGELR